MKASQPSDGPPQDQTSSPNLGRTASSKKLLIIGVSLLVLAGLGLSLYHAVRPTQKATNTKVTGGVNCKTFRNETLKALNGFTDFKLIERKYTCIAGLDTHDQAKMTLVKDESTTKEQLQAAVARVLQQSGWQDKGDLSFSLHAQAENHAVEYAARFTLERNSPTVLRVTFSSSRDAKADFGSSKDFPADIKLSPENINKYAVVAPLLPSFMPPGYQARQVPQTSLDQASVELVSTAKAADGKAAVSPTLVYGVMNQPASSCGDSAAASDRHKVCELLGTTASGRQVYVPRFITDSGEKKELFNDTYAVIGTTSITFLYSYHHPSVNPQLTTEQILKIIDSLQPSR